MKNDKNIENMLRNAVSHAAPDARDAILSACDHEKGKVIYMEKKRSSPLRGFVAVAAVLVLIIAGVFAVKNLGAPSDTLAAVVSLDVNPSIELNVDKDEKISSLEVAVNAVIGSMLKNGYLDDMANSILVSVSGVNGYDADKLRSTLADDVNRQLENCSVLSQDVSNADSDTVKLADKYGITVGKAALIRQIVAADSRHSFEELAPLSINELNLIADGKTLSGIASDGAAASSKAYIGRDAAVDAALGHAGVTRSEVRKLDVDLDYEHGSMVYEVEFKVGTAEYEYDIGAADGDIIWYEIERDGTVEQGGSAIDGKAAISADDAKTAALNHAGLTASQVTHLKTELDREGGKLVYEVEFKSGGHEYEYVIDAATGAVIKSEKEHD